MTRLHPAMPRQSAPREIASRASSARSSPWSSITVSTPSEEANSTNPNFWTLPPPDHGLHRRTGCEGRCHTVHPACGGGPETRGEHGPRGQNGNRQQRKRDERSDEGFPVLVPGQKQRSDEDGRAHDHPDDSVPPARSPFRDRPPPTGDGECEAGRTDNDVHAVAEEKAEQRGSEEHDRDEREDGESSLSSRRGATRVTHGVSPPLRPRCTSRGPFVLTSLGRTSIRCRCGVVMTRHHSLVFSLAAL